jgi:hypothetical protein
MYSIEKKDSLEACGVEHLTWQSPAFGWQSQNLRSEATEQDARAEKSVASTAFQQLLKHLAAQEEEVIMLALRHAHSSGSFFDRMRGRYRQLLPPLQAETRRAIQFLILQALAMTCEKHPELQTLEPLVQRVCDCPAETVREHLADYFAQPTAPGEVFAHNVWELIHGPREKERFAVFALRMESCLRRLLAECVSVLEAFATAADSITPCAIVKGD